MRQLRQLRQSKGLRGLNAPFSRVLPRLAKQAYALSGFRYFVVNRIWPPLWRNCSAYLVLPPFTIVGAYSTDFAKPSTVTHTT